MAFWAQRSAVGRSDRSAQLRRCGCRTLTPIPNHLKLKMAAWSRMERAELGAGDQFACEGRSVDKASGQRNLVSPAARLAFAKQRA